MVHCTYKGVIGLDLVITQGKLFISIANSTNPDEMPYCVTFHLGLHCLHKYGSFSSSM